MVTKIVQSRHSCHCSLLDKLCDDLTVFKLPPTHLFYNELKSADVLISLNVSRTRNKIPLPSFVVRTQRSHSTTNLKLLVYVRYYLDQRKTGLSNLDKLSLLKVQTCIYNVKLLYSEFLLCATGLRLLLLVFCSFYFSELL